MTNQLGNDLRAHREKCGKCTKVTACDDYIAITNTATAQRVIREGPVMGHTRLSILEAEAR